MQKRRIGTKWLSYRMTQLFCIDFCDYGEDPAGLLAEIEAAEAVIGQQAENTLLAAIDLSLTDFTEEIVAFINQSASRPKNPFRKIAILGIPPWKRAWYCWTKHVTWPQNARFFEEYEKAKSWLVTEDF